MSTEFDLAAVEEAVAGTRFHGSLMHCVSVGSTNQLALAHANAGGRSGVWVADEQTSGRGRGGHAWHSAAGEGLYVSVLAVPSVPLRGAAKIPLATGLAAQAAVLEATGLKPDIRWPNDLMFAEKKFGGILVESASDGVEMRFAVIGIGVNVSHQEFPRELREIATSLFLESGRSIRREPLLASLLRHLDEELLRLDGQAPADENELLRRFAEASSWVSGKQVAVDGDGGYHGVTRGLDAQGFLRVEDDDGVLHTVLSGGVRSA